MGRPIGRLGQTRSASCRQILWAADDEPTSAAVMMCGAAVPIRRPSASRHPTAGSYQHRFPFHGGFLLLVNVAVRCGATPLHRRQGRFAPRPCGTGPDGPALDPGRGVARGRYEATLERRFVEKRPGEAGVALSCRWPPVDRPPGQSFQLPGPMPARPPPWHTTGAPSDAQPPQPVGVDDPHWRTARPPGRCRQAACWPSDGPGSNTAKRAA